ncbi:GAF domain-containing sensor histidine kinase [Staphylococcus edaphicus]|uniref:histidine kinase n=1 Tax=Staphylococcus edaphicus TaxID=1955013 RepID=A0A2C6WP21_9STAP|nr:GAF domain-containing sensor histidine kinase [Staphylococcus edaphicus]PHK50820.1 histidine kinase [Staphylococcus edaphicus]UQW82515.1 GAF domain-containing sensor histidine kinase [Staphylococcus edaphicus]
MEKPTRLALLKEIAEFLNEETETYSMMNGALKYLIEGTEFTTGWIFFIDDVGQHELVSHFELPGALARDNCKYMSEGTCWCVQAYQNKKLTKASNIINCSRINLANRAHHEETNGITHHATVPLRSGEELFGLLNVATPYKTTYSEEDLELLESVALQIGSAIKRIILTDQEKEAARISERNRLARDLHDAVNQLLFSVKLTAHAAQGITKESVSRNAFNLIEDTSQQAVNEMRSLIWQLKPVGLEQGLVYALKNYSEILQIKLNVSVDGLINLPSPVEENVYRIIQEAMNNTKKHANTGEVKVSLTQNNQYLTIDIEDMGNGFNMSQVNLNYSHGINNMRQRTKAIKGTLDIKSIENKGTNIHVQVPL